MGRLCKAGGEREVRVGVMRRRAAGVVGPHNGKLMQDYFATTSSPVQQQRLTDLDLLGRRLLRRRRCRRWRHARRLGCCASPARRLESPGGEPSTGSGSSKVLGKG